MTEAGGGDGAGQPGVGAGAVTGELGRAPAVYDDIFRVLKRVDIRLCASLPDDWVAPLIDLLHADGDIRHVRVARESEIIGICSGAFFGGVRAVGIMGATGFLTCISEICTLNLRHQIPILLIVSLRGRLGDLQVFQEVQGRVVLPLLETLGLPHLILDDPRKIALLADAYDHARFQKRPYVVGLSKALLRGVASEF